jgi:serine/threonine protein phosphatase PrpC
MAEIRRKTLQIHGTAASDRGRRRQSNEDAFFADDALGLYVVCDGMGGHRAGEVASTLATEAVVDIVRAWRTEQAAPPTADLSPTTLLETVQEAVAHACRVVHRAATDDLTRAGMGCTLTMLLVAGRRAVMGHVGDTRLYLLREGKLHQLSHDHTMAADLARMGDIPKDEIKTHRLAHVLTRCIGGHTAVPVDTLSVDLLPGDRFILCSDGLSDYADIGGDLGDHIEDVELNAQPNVLI